MNFRRYRAVARKEFIHVTRDWRSLMLAIAIPILLIALFGHALTMDLKNVPTAVLDHSKTEESRRLLSLFSGSPYFSLDYPVQSEKELQHLMDTGKVMAGLVIPLDFAPNIRGGKTAAIQAVLDGSNTNNATLALGYVSAISAIYNRKVMVKRARLFKTARKPGRADLVPRAWYNPDMQSRLVIVPGIIALVMVVIAAMLTSVTVAREWETGTMEQLISTPVRKTELIMGKVTPYFAIGMLDVAVAVAMGRFIFDVPLRGAPALVFAMASVFLIGALFLGLVLSIALKTQVLANQIALVLGYLPTLMLSGFVFGIHNMPVPIQAITYLVPARYFIAMLKGIFLKGIGLEILWVNALLLSLYALVMVMLAHRKLNLQLEG